MKIKRTILNKLDNIPWLAVRGLAFHVLTTATIAVGVVQQQPIDLVLGVAMTMLWSVGVAMLYCSVDYDRSIKGPNLPQWIFTAFAWANSILFFAAGIWVLSAAWLAILLVYNQAWIQWRKLQAGKFRW